MKSPKSRFTVIVDEPVTSLGTSQHARQLDSLQQAQAYLAEKTSLPGVSGIIVQPWTLDLRDSDPLSESACGV